MKHWATRRFGFLTAVFVILHVTFGMAITIKNSRNCHIGTHPQNLKHPGRQITSTFKCASFIWTSQRDGSCGIGQGLRFGLVWFGRYPAYGLVRCCTR